MASFICVDELLVRECYLWNFNCEHRDLLWFATSRTLKGNSVVGGFASVLSTEINRVSSTGFDHITQLLHQNSFVCQIGVLPHFLLFFFTSMEFYFDCSGGWGSTNVEVEKQPGKSSECIKELSGVLSLCRLRRLLDCYKVIWSLTNKM